MFKVDAETNRLTPLKQERFSNLKFREREHLQEWLANRPNVLGEELLIIQKEFDGFHETRERLDLLALDKSGRLVIIENKLDDSGRDVIWQALKYAAYASSLSKSQIIQIFQDYLDKSKCETNATDALAEFLEVADLSEATLNTGNSQRLIFIAANFRKEVTTTALWLINSGVSVQCFKVTPFSMNDETLIDLKQIIPTPEAADFMIGMAQKESSERRDETAVKASALLRQQYWSQLLEALKNEDDKIFQNISAGKDHWLNATAGIRLATYEFHLLKTQIRVLLTISRGSQEENKWLYDLISTKSQEIEERFGAKLEWLRLDDKQSSRVQYSFECDGYDKSQWNDYIHWHVGHMSKLQSAFQIHVDTAYEELKAAKNGQ